MDRLVNNLPSSMQQRIRRGADEDDSLSDGGSDRSGDEDTGWGRKKKAYWSGDTADLEIGQDMEDAEDEEEAAMVHDLEPISSSLMLLFVLGTRSCSQLWSR